MLGLVCNTMYVCMVLVMVTIILHAAYVCLCQLSSNCHAFFVVSLYMHVLSHEVTERFYYFVILPLFNFRHISPDLLLSVVVTSELPSPVEGEHRRRTCC